MNELCEVIPKTNPVRKALFFAEEFAYKKAERKTRVSDIHFTVH